MMSSFQFIGYLGEMNINFEISVQNTLLVYEAQNDYMILLVLNNRFSLIYL